jgi:hypothetical protein
MRNSVVVMAGACGLIGIALAVTGFIYVDVSHSVRHIMSS